MIRLGLQVWGEEHRGEEPFPPHPVKGSMIATSLLMGDADLDLLEKAVSVSFPYGSSLFFSFSYTILWKPQRFFLIA